MTGITISLTRLPHGAGLPLPAYETEQSAGMDIRAAVTDPVDIPPGGRALIPTGFKMALPRGFEAQIRPRSGRSEERRVGKEWRARGWRGQYKEREGSVSAVGALA